MTCLLYEFKVDSTSTFRINVLFKLEYKRLYSDWKGSSCNLTQTLIQMYNSYLNKHIPLNPLHLLVWLSVRWFFYVFPFKNIIPILSDSILN
jgi:hypothetical protein